MIETCMRDPEEKESARVRGRQRITKRERGDQRYSGIYNAACITVTILHVVFLYAWCKQQILRLRPVNGP